MKKHIYTTVNSTTANTDRRVEFKIYEENIYYKNRLYQQKQMTSEGDRN